MHTAHELLLQFAIYKRHWRVTLSLCLYKYLFYTRSYCIITDLGCLSILVHLILTTINFYYKLSFKNWRELSSLGRGKEIHSSNKQVRILYCVYDLARLSICGWLKHPPCVSLMPPHMAWWSTQNSTVWLSGRCVHLFGQAQLCHALSCNATICQIVISSSGAQFLTYVRLSSYSTVWTLENHAAVLCQLHAEYLTGPKGGTR